MDRAEFEFLCSLMPADKCWGGEITPEFVKYIVAQSCEMCLIACQGERLCDPVSEPGDIAYEHAIDDCIHAIRRLKR